MAVRRKTNEGGSQVTTGQTGDTEGAVMQAQLGESLGKKGKKKKKKKYSSRLQFPQEVEVGATRAADRLAGAVEDGLSKWRKTRNKSARKKRDGAIQDAIKNSGRAVSSFTKAASKIPEDLTSSWPKALRVFR
jgi:hypothetical protein